ncbi:MAG: hypothetical protein GWN30_21475 [Gammaproteobacteria bacterium]|nr:hypothetical protein [Gammaproteobacteria bacterium]
MFHLQYLTQRGHDWQLVWVIRRDLITGQSDANEMTMAWKFHWVTMTGDYDLMLARHYGQSMVGLGMAKNAGSLVIRADLLSHDLSVQDDWLYLINTDYTWDCFNKNCHFFIEYFHNEAGQKGIDLATILPGSKLYERLNRGELYVLGTDYLGLGLNTQLTALSSVNLTVMWNLQDNSNFSILGYLYEFQQNLQFQTGLMLSSGGANTEFGGLYDSVNTDYQASASMVFAQLAYYF